MRYRDAAKLHPTDEVVDKTNRAICRVVAVHVHPERSADLAPYVEIDVISPVDGYLELTHRNVR